MNSGTVPPEGAIPSPGLPAVPYFGRNLGITSTSTRFNPQSWPTPQPARGARVLVLDGHRPTRPATFSSDATHSFLSSCEPSCGQRNGSYHIRPSGPRLAYPRAGSHEVTREAGDPSPGVQF